MAVGELNVRARRPSTPGSNGQILFNQAGVEGAANVTYNISTNSLSLTGNITSTLSGANVPLGVYSANASNLAITVQANGEVSFDTRLPPGGGSGNYEVDVFLAGASVLTNANLNFINTTSINAVAVANGTTQVNVSFAINTSMNLVSLNVSGNISNTGNLLVTQNTFTGNLSVTALANITSLNVSANISNVGNLLVTQNTFTGNLSVTTQANITSLNVSANISNVGNLLVTQNTFTGNLNITQNTNTGNLTTSNIQNVSIYLALFSPDIYALAGGV